MSTLGRRLPSWLAWVVVPVVAVSVITGVGLLFSDDTNSVPLDPANPGPDGTMALAQVLAGHGVQVRTVTTHEQLIAADPDRNDTVVITSSRDLHRRVARSIVPVLRRAGRVVVVVDSHGRLSDLGLPVNLTSHAPDKALKAACSVRLVPPGAQTADLGREFTTSARGWRGCFNAGRGHELVTGPYGSATAVVIGSTDFARNDRILSTDNAQLATWLYGSSSRLIWYRPDPNDVLGGDGDTQGSLAPTWFEPVLGMLGVAVLMLMVAAGRRFGPLSREPLPVIVSALETTRARGRLYRGAGDLRHSTTVLRTAAVRRLATRLGLPANARADQVVGLLGSSHPNARDLLLGPLPNTAGAAARWLDDLRSLEAATNHEGTTQEGAAHD